MSDTVTITALVAVAVALSKVIEVLVTKILNGKNGNGKENITHKIDQILEWQSVRDMNGVPMGYFPRSIVENQEKIASTLRDCVVIQEKVVDELSRIADRLEKLSDNIDGRLDDLDEDFVRMQKSVNGSRS